MKKLLIAFAIALVLCGCRATSPAKHEFTITRSNGSKVVVQGDYIDSKGSAFWVVLNNNVVFSVPNTSVTNVEIKPLDLGSDKDGLN